MRDQTARTSFPPQNLGKYEVRRLLGEGSMGMVFEAWDPTLERDVAIKVMAGASLYDDTMRQRFEREAKAVAKLKHPNIVTIHDLGKDAAGSPFIAMELLEGEDLAALIESSRNPSLAKKLDLMVQVCRGLEHAHAAGIVHRDIKPANIYVTKDGTAKIMDFGVARWTRAAQTQAGIVVGTAGYIAPEQLRGNSVDGRSDLFSLGVVLYEVLTNDLLYSGDTLETIFFKTLSKATPRLALPDGDELPGLQTILDKALAKEIEDRYPSAADMGQAIETFVRSHDELLSRTTVLKGRDPDAPGRVSFRRSSSQNPTRRVEIPTLSSSADASATGGTLDSTAGSGSGPTPTYTRTAPRPRNLASGPRGRKKRMPAYVPALLVVVVAAVLGAYVAMFQPQWVFGGGPNSNTDNPPSSQPTQASGGGSQASGPRPAPAPPESTSTPVAPDPSEKVTAIVAEAALAINASDLESAKRLIEEGETLAPGDERIAKLSEQVRSLEAKTRWKQDAAKLVRRAERELAAGDHAAAIDSFKNAMEYDPDNADARRGLSRAIEAMQSTQTPPEPARPAEPEVQPRRVVEGRTEFIPATPADELSGFVQEEGFEVGGTAETSPAQVTIELTPTDAKPGEPYIVRVRVFNEGYRTIQLNGMELVSQFEDGVSGRGQTLPVRVSRVEPQSTVVVYEASGTWKETQNRGAIEATVKLADGGRLRKNIRW